MDLAERAFEEETDEVLVQKVRDGDGAALSALYRRYVSAIYRFILAQVRDAQDAEDLCSETFARMLRGIDGFRGQASFKNWLYQIARNAVRNHRRAAGYRRSVPLTRHLKAPADMEVMGASGEDTGKLAQVLALLKPLPPRYRQVLELRFLEGRTIGETAEQMGITVANVKVLQHRALKKAAAVMEEGEVEAGRARG
jgi:RNA polymerase sigma-70 factor (ECF subfamily)